MFKVLVIVYIVFALSGPCTPFRNPEENPFRIGILTLKPGKPKIVTNAGYEEPDGGDGDIRYTFNVKDGYGIVASCEDDYRPTVNYSNPCQTFTMTFHDGEYKKQFCSFDGLTETYYMTNRSKLFFRMNYTEDGWDSIVRCVFRTTEPLPEPTEIFQVSNATGIYSPNRTSFSDGYYLMESENGEPFNIDCQFTGTESSYCILSRVIMKVGNEEMFCLSRDYRRKNITKAEMRVWSDRNGWPKINCKFTTGTTGNPNTPKMPPYGKKSRRDSIERKERKHNVVLEAGETRLIVARKHVKNVVELNIKVSEGFNVYVFCQEYQPEYDGTLPCDTFEMTMEESGRIPEKWCSQRRLESLGYVSNGPNLKMTIENFSEKNNVTCAIRSSEPPSPFEEFVLDKNNSIYRIPEEPFVLKRWIVSHAENGTIKVECDRKILRRIYHNALGVGSKRQYYCNERRIQVNEDLICEEPEPVTDEPIVFEARGKADILIISDQLGWGGCKVYGQF